jgi:hypothetical protein
MKRTNRKLIITSYDRFVRDLARLEKARCCDCELTGLAFFIGDAIHHLCTVLGELADLERPDMQEPESMLGAQTESTAVLTREAFLAVLAIGQLLRQEEGMAFTKPKEMIEGHAAVARMLDALSPYVSRGELDLRRIVIDGVEPEVIDLEISDAS